MGGSPGPERQPLTLPLRAAPDAAGPLVQRPYRRCGRPCRCWRCAGGGAAAGAAGAAAGGAAPVMALLPVPVEALLPVRLGTCPFIAGGGKAT